MTTEELLQLCDRMSNIAGCIPKNKHIWNAHGVCQWCHQSRLIVDAAEMSAALRKSLADVERLTKERDEWQRSNAAAVAALTRVACANEEWLPTYIAKAREMLAGKERDERLQAALRHFTAMEAELAALRQRVPQPCGVPTDIGMYFYDREEFGWYPCEVIRTSNGVLLGMMGGIARNIATMKRRWATCPPPAGDKGG